MSAFQTVEELRETRTRRFSGSSMFERTLRFSFRDPERAWLKTEVVELGKHVELWRVTSSGHEISLEEPNKITYLLPIHGRLDVATGGSEYKAEAGSALLFSPNNRRTRVSPAALEHYEALVILLPKNNVNRAIAGDRRLPADLAKFLPVGLDKSEGLRAYTTFLGAELSRNASPIARPRGLSEAAVLLEDMLIDLVGGDDSFLNKRQSAGADYVERAEELMRARFDEAMTMTEIADALNISLRSLQMAFCQHRGITPRTLLNRIRLEEARKRLRNPKPGENVSGIAFDCGFTHLGRFAIAYRKAFGELPSETLR